MGATASPPQEYQPLLDALHARSTVADCSSWDPAQWDRTLRLAAWHRLSPLLFSHLAQRGLAPPHVLAVLERAYLDNTARNLMLGASLQRALDALAGATIPAMVLKGAALIESVYPDAGLREMIDLDILVPADRLDDGNDALATIGFALANPTETERDTRAWMRANHLHDPVLASEDRIVAVELHHHIATPAERAYFDVADLWQRARPGRGAAYLLPSPEDLLLHACFHFTRDRAVRSDGALGQICDIARIVACTDVDWNAFESNVRTYRLQSRVFLALFAARELGVAIADQAMHDLCPQGFDPRMGRRLVELRVLRMAEVLPVRSLRRMLAPTRQTLVERWEAGPDAGSRALTGAYLRRAAARAPHARAALKAPRETLRDRQLSAQIRALERRERAMPAR